MENRVVHAFSNTVRLKLLCCLNDGSKNVEELISNCGLAQSAVSQHLSKLKSAGLIKSKRKGRFIYYYLADKKTGHFAKNFSSFIREVN